MMIQITKPEVEALIKQRLQSGSFKDAEDVILQALQSFPANAGTTKPGDAPSTRSLQEVFEEVKGLADDIDFNRSTSMGRPVNMS